MNQIAQTILNQLGGNQFIAMTGGHSFTTERGSDCLTFKFKGSRKSNTCRVVLNGLDLYDVDFFKFSPKTFACPKTYSIGGIYADQLRSVFEDHTGLFTNL